VGDPGREVCHHLPYMSLPFNKPCPKAGCRKSARPV
jgi:hypothetical protein